MARRLVERGVRMVQIYHGTWDHHADILGHKYTAGQVDGPIAALVRDLKQRGMLDRDAGDRGRRVRTNAG